MPRKEKLPAGRKLHDHDINAAVRALDLMINGSNKPTSGPEDLAEILRHYLLDMFECKSEHVVRFWHEVAQEHDLPSISVMVGGGR